MQSVLHSYIPLNSMMGIGYTYVWKNKRMGKEGVPGCRPSVVAVAGAATLPPLAGGGLRLAIHPCDFLSWLPASAVPYQLLLHCCRFTNFLSASSNRQLARYTVTTGYIKLHSYNSLCTTQFSSQPTTIIVHCRFCRTEIKQRQTTHTKKVKTSNWIRRDNKKK